MDKSFINKNLFHGNGWDSLSGLYGLDFQEYFLFNGNNKLESFQIENFNKKIYEIENQKRQSLINIHDKICELKKLKSLKKCNVIEIGSGLGVMANTISDKVNSLLCLDINPHLLEYCKEFNKEKNNITYHRIENLMDFSWIKNIDLVYSQSVFIHLSVMDFYVYFQELYKTLNKNGIIYIDIIDGDLESFTFKESELEKQTVKLKNSYQNGTSSLFSINSSSILEKTANELGYKLVYKEQINSKLPNVTMAFQKTEKLI